MVFVMQLSFVDSDPALQTVKDIMTDKRISEEDKLSLSLLTLSVLISAKIHLDGRCVHRQTTSKIRLCL